MTDVMWSLWVLLPLLYSVFTASGLWLVYYVAPTEIWLTPLESQYGPFDPPYIGNAAYTQPGSCIFGGVMNVSAFMGFTIAVLRYRQLKHRMDKPWLNISSLVVFSFACVGMLITANIPFSVNFRISNIGCYITFGLGLLFCWMQTYITLKVNLMNEGRKVGFIRFLLSASITVCMILYFYLMFQDFDRSGARCQWVLVMLLLVFLGTFAIEFRHDHFYIECRESCENPSKMSEMLSDVSKSNCVTFVNP
uniref:CWH43-like N-terminal domain-containing protein n=1 Tax=Anabas testudineus TaxID=64144 RepID=A0A3Q1HST6_ANATE